MPPVYSFLLLRGNVARTLVVAQGINMVRTGATIQHNVGAAVHEMLGMDVKDVNIYIQKIE